MFVDYIIVGDGPQTWGLGIRTPSKDERVVSRVLELERDRRARVVIDDRAVGTIPLKDGPDDTDNFRPEASAH